MCTTLLSKIESCAKIDAAICRAVDVTSISTRVYYAKLHRTEFNRQLLSTLSVYMMYVIFRTCGGIVQYEAMIIKIDI